MKDIAGRKLLENDEVTLLHVTDAMVLGLPDEEVAILRSMAGKVVTVSEVDETSVEVMMTDTNSGMVHFLRITGTDVEIGSDTSKSR